MAWLASCWRYFANNSFDLGFGGSVTDNAAGNAQTAIAPNLPSGVKAIGEMTRLFSVGVWLLAGVGTLLCLWTMRRVGVLVLAAMVPFGILVVQSYGGEAIYRVYLYSLPLMAALIAFALVNSSPLLPRRRRFLRMSCDLGVVCAVGGRFLGCPLRSRANQPGRSLGGGDGGVDRTQRGRSGVYRAVRRYVSGCEHGSVSELTNQ